MPMRLRGRRRPPPPRRSLCPRTGGAPTAAAAAVAAVAPTKRRRLSLVCSLMDVPFERHVPGGAAEPAAPPLVCGWLGGRPEHDLVRALLRLLAAAGVVGVAGNEHGRDVRRASVRLVD